MNQGASRGFGPIFHSVTTDFPDHRFGVVQEPVQHGAGSGGTIMDLRQRLSSILSRPTVCAAVSVLMMSTAAVNQTEWLAAR